jgi:hypothetical protein
VTEAEWLACTDPQKMLKFLRGKASDRKLRLFACGCCRRIWGLLADPRSRRAVEVAEQFADFRVEATVLAAARGAAREVCQVRPAHRQPVAWQGVAATAAYGAAAREVREAVLHTPGCVVRAVIARHGGQADRGWRPVRRQEALGQAALLRDIFGPLPFGPVPVDAAWLSWKGGTIARLAEAIYEERSFGRLPVLADALEEAGCTNEEALAHLRGPGPHTRGCWPLDLLLRRG